MDIRIQTIVILIVLLCWYPFCYILHQQPVQCMEKHHQLSACLFVQRFAAKKQYKDVKAVMITHFFSPYIFPFFGKVISGVCKSCLSKYLFVSSFVLQWNLTVWHFQGSRFGQRMKIFTSFPPWLTNTVRACIQIFYLLATNTTWICKKCVFLLSSFGRRMKILKRFQPWLTMFGKYSKSMHTNLVYIKPTDTNYHKL